MPIETSKGIFVHLQKTGGTFISNILIKGLGGSKISKAHDPYHILPNKTKPGFVFVRHPLNWLISTWSQAQNSGVMHRARINMARKDQYMTKHYTPFIVGMMNKDINNTIKTYLEKYPGYITKLYMDYTKDCDYIGKTENLREDLYGILSALGEDVEKVEDRIFNGKKLNTSTRKKEILLDGNLVKKFLKSESEILKKFEYEE